MNIQSLSHATLLFTLCIMGVTAIVVSVALWRDMNAGVFAETHVCEACGYEASSVDSIFCKDCDELCS